MRWTVGRKLFGTIGLLLLLMSSVAAASGVLISRVGDALENLTTQGMPLADAAVRINVLALERNLFLERQLTRFQENLPEARLGEEGRRQELGNAIQGLLDQMKRQIGPDPRILEVERRFWDLVNWEEQMLPLLQTGEQDKLATLTPELARFQDGLDQSLTAFRRGLEEKSLSALRQADRDERFLLVFNLSLTLMAALAGGLFAFLLTRSVVDAVRALATGAAEVEAGRLDTEVRVASRDELGSLGTAFNHMTVGLKLKERIKETFGRYMDPRIVARLLEKPEMTSPGGEMRVMTVMFVDLKGFTTLSERLSPTDLVTLINRFFTMVSKTVSAHGGVVDKYMGDAVMAYWGPPFTSPDDHARLACEAALEIQRELPALRRWAGETFAVEEDSLDLRIGVASGEMVVGTMGSETSRNFTVMGDPVNLGSRLEGACKTYGLRILISGTTRALVGASVAAREIDAIRVKGKETPTPIFEPLDPEMDREMAEKLFSRGLANYRRGLWDKAEATFRKVLEDNPKDGPAQVFLDRIPSLRADPPPPGWDGVWRMTTK